MQDKVKELALVAQLGPVMLLNYYGKVDALTDSEQEDLEKLTRFAELILKDCINLLVDRRYMVLNTSEPFAFERVRALKEHDKYTIKTIKEHFGL